MILKKVLYYCTSFNNCSDCSAGNNRSPAVALSATGVWCHLFGGTTSFAICKSLCIVLAP